MRRRHDARAMARLLARRVRDGLTWAELSHRSGIAVSTLLWWRSRLALDAPDDKDRRSPFVEVALDGVPCPASNFEIVIGDSLSVRVPRGFDPDELHRLLRALGARC